MSGIALVAGAGQGIGRAVAPACAAEGYRVTAVDRDAENIDRPAVDHDRITGHVTDTAMRRRLWSDDGPAAGVDGDLAGFRTGTPLGRPADPEDIAEAVLSLASGRARHITMHDLYVDGGATLRA